MIQSRCHEFNLIKFNFTQNRSNRSLLLSHRPMHAASMAENTHHNLHQNIHVLVLKDLCKTVSICKYIEKHFTDFVINDSNSCTHWHFVQPCSAVLCGPVLSEQSPADEQGFPYYRTTDEFMLLIPENESFSQNLKTPSFFSPSTLKDNGYSLCPSITPLTDS